MTLEIEDLAVHGELSANLVGFCRFLRSEGLGIGPGEERDALRALGAIDLKDSPAFQLALRTTLAKTPAEQKTFDELFEHYWQIWARASRLNKPRANPDREQTTTAQARQPRKTAYTSVHDWLKQGDPTTEELAENLDVPPKKVEDMIQIARRPLSLEMPTDDLEDSLLGDFIEDEDSPAPADAVTYNMLQGHIEEALTGLPPREVRILQLRYGLLDGESYTLEEVGRKMGVTRERVRQIEAQALGRLRNPDQKRILEGFLRDY